MPSVEDVLQAAIKNSEPVTIIYHGGSQAGSRRTIIPRSLSNGRVRALCLNSHKVKLFIASKMELVVGEEATASVEAWDPTKPPKSPEKHVDKFTSLEQVYEAHRQELEELGWHVKLEGNFLSLRRYFKNGKPRKRSDALLAYEGHTVRHLAINEDGEEIVILKETDRPWYCASLKYKYLDRAVERFLTNAHEQAPNSNL